MTIRLFGLEFEEATLAQAVDQVLRAAKARRKGLIVTPNVDHIVRMNEDAEMPAIYRRALHRYADGMPLVWLSRIVDPPGLPERVTGADLLPAVCRAAAREGLSVYFLGGNAGVAERAAISLAASHHGLKVSGTCCPPFGFEKDPAESIRILEAINRSKADILFIGVGNPKQEIWSDTWLERLETGPVLCVGAAFDFAAGTLNRAPIFLQRAGLEWLWRLMLEPGRLWKRYLLRGAAFIPLAFRELCPGRPGGAGPIKSEPPARNNPGSPGDERGRGGTARKR